MKKLLSSLIIIFFFSCTSLEKEYDTHLKNGLKTFAHTKDVNNNFLPGLSLRKIAFIEKSNEKTIVIRLNDDALESDVKKYSLAVKIYLDKIKYKNLLNGRDYISRPIKPSLTKIKNFKYIEMPFLLDVKEIIKIEFFLFDRDKFKKVLGKPITISDVEI